MAPNGPKPRVEDLKTNFSPRNIDLIAKNNQYPDSPLKVHRNTVYERPREQHYNNSPVRPRSNSVTLNSSRLPELIEITSSKKRSPIKKTTKISDSKNRTEVKRPDLVFDQGQQYRTEESEEEQSAIDIFQQKFHQRRKPRNLPKPYSTYDVDA